jgi:hypothetical protein
LPPRDTRTSDVNGDGEADEGGDSGLKALDADLVEYWQERPEL